MDKKCSIFGCDNHIGFECSVCSNNLCSECSLKLLKFCECNSTNEHTFIIKCPFCSIITRVDKEGVDDLMFSINVENIEISVCG